MTLVVWIYIWSYAAIWTLAAAAQALDEEGEQDPLWERALDAIFIAVGFAGMLLYQKSPDLPWLRDLWKVVTVTLVVGHLLLHIRDALQLFGKDGTYREEGPVTVWTAAVFAVFLLGPSLLLNFLYAFELVG